MKNRRAVSWFFLLLILLTIFVTVTMAQETPPAEPVPLAPWVEEDASQRAVDLAEDELAATEQQQFRSPDQSNEVCRQLLRNIRLDVTFEGDEAYVLPWKMLGNVYYNSYIYHSPEHSLVLVNNEKDDPEPEDDAFAQVVSVPLALKSVTIEYHTYAIDSNLDDYTGAALWIWDDEEEEPLIEYVYQWEIEPLERSWQRGEFEITDSLILEKLQGAQIALIFFNDTTIALVQTEQVYFDDITFTACSDGFEIFLPAVMK